MDEVKLTAQQRFDLLDMTRFKSYIQEALADIISDIFGAAHHNDGAAGFLQKKPLIVKNFNVSEAGPPSLVLRAERTWSGGADGTYSAHIYDQSGSRITGPNSPAYRDLTVAAAPGATTRYLMVRRVVGGTDDTPEARKFYTTAGAHSTVTVNTRTIDDYELQDSTTSADTDATLSAAGWVDIATFQTDGAGDINVGPTALAPSVERDLLTWATAPPAADQTIITLFENIQILVQLMKQIRYGEGSGRTWTDKVTNDASFDEEGGIRWGKGDTLDTGKSAVYTRAQGADEVVTDSNATAAALTDLESHMAGPFLARADNSTYGHTYASAIGSDNPATITREWSYGCTSMTSVGSVAAEHVDPWTVAANPAANTEAWYLYIDLGAPAVTTCQYRMHYTTGATGKTAGLICGIILPDLCQIEEVSWRVDFQNHLGNNGNLKCYTGLTDNLAFTTTQTYDFTSGGIFSAGGAGNVIAYSSGTHIHSPGTTKFYETWFSFYTSGGASNPTTGTLVHVNGVYVKVNIREASYVY